MHRSRTWGSVASGRPRRIRLLAEVCPLESRLLLSATVPTSTTLAASTPAPIYGQAVTLTATVAGAPGSSAPTGGIVTFLDGRTALGSMPVANGSAALTIATLPVGAHALSAVYGGDGATYLGSTAMASPSSVITTAASGPGAYPLGMIEGVAVDKLGDVFFSDSSKQAVRELKPDGTIVTVAGDGTWGHTGDGGPATAAELSFPQALAIDAAGDLFIGEGGDNKVREVTPDGTIITVAGDGRNGNFGDGGPATVASIDDPAGLAVDAAGDLFIAAGTVREVKPDGIITTVAGGEVTYTGNPPPASSAAAVFDDAVGVAVDAAGDLFIAEDEKDLVREVTPDGTIATVAGIGVLADTGDGGPATTAAVGRPVALAVDAADDLLIVEWGSRDPGVMPDGPTIRMVTPTGLITTIAGNSHLGNGGDGGAASAASLYEPDGVAADAAGHLFIADSVNDDVREVASVAPLVVTVARPSGAVATVTTASASTASAVRGQSVTLTAVVAPAQVGAPSGTVSFVDGGIVVGTAPLVVSGGVGTATLTVSDLAIGADRIAADYGGDLGHAPSSSGAVAVAVGRDPTTIAVTPSTAIAGHGQRVTFEAVVLAKAPGVGTPGGTVTFEEGGVVLGKAQIGTSGGVVSASLTIPAPGVGSSGIEAVYEGDSGDLPSTVVVPLTVVPASTTTVFGPSTVTPIVGRPVTLYAVVADVAPGAGAPTGTVVFRDGGKVLGTAPLVTDALRTYAALTTSSLSAGSHAITASYGGDAFDRPSVAPAGNVHVVTSATTTVLSAFPLVGVGRPATLTATVRYASGIGTPTGLVAFTIGTRVLAFVPLTVVDGVATATYTTPPLGPGDYPFTATYGGPGGMLVSTGSTDIEVFPNSSHVVGAASSGATTFGQPVTLTAVVTSRAVGPDPGPPGAPTGLVGFWEGWNLVGTATLTPVGDGVSVARLSTSTLALGAHTLKAFYSGDWETMPWPPSDPFTVSVAPPAQATASALWLAALDALGPERKAP